MFVACPYCGAPVVIDGGLRGQLVACTSCAREFQVPSPNQPFNPVGVGQSPPVIHQQPVTSGHPRIPRATAVRPRKRKRHWAKTAMLVLTICWPLAIIGCGMMSSVSTQARYRDAGHGYHLDTERMDLVSSRERQSLMGWSFLGGSVCVTFVYFGAMFMLGVIWFTTKDDRD
jgi:hypothetical protein